jgi:hypothetical protein
MAYSRRKFGFWGAHGCNAKASFAADLLLMQQTEIIDSNLDCSSGLTRIVGDGFASGANQASVK